MDGTIFKVAWFQFWCAWVSSVKSSFLPQYKDMQIVKLIEKLWIDLKSEWLWMSAYIAAT